MLAVDLLVVHRLVVEAGDIDRIGQLVLDGAGPVIERGSRGPGGILFVEEAHEAARDLCAIGAALLHHLVADAPQDDRRMVAVAVDHIADVALAPLIEKLGVAVGDFGDAPHVEGFVHDDDAHAVAGFEHLGRGRIVAGTERVDARGLENLKLALDRAAVDGGAERAEIVMIADALNAHAAAVEQEPFLLVEGDGADAERRGVAVDDAGVVEDLAHQRVEIGTVDIPALRAGDGQRSRDGLGAAGGQHRVIRLPRDLAARGVENGGAQDHAAFRARAVAQPGLDLVGRRCIANLCGGDLSSPAVHVHRTGNIEPDVAIDARAGIPAGGVVLRSEPHGHDVFLRAVAEVWREVAGKADVPVRAAADFLAVDPDVRIVHGAVEFEREIAVAEALRDGEMFAVPAGAEDRQRAGVGVQMRIEWAFDRPIVRQTDFAPRAVLEIGSLGSSGFAFEEAPAIVEGLAAFGGAHSGGGVRGGCGERQERAEEEDTAGDHNRLWYDSAGGCWGRTGGAHPWECLPVPHSRYSALSSLRSFSNCFAIAKV